MGGLMKDAKSMDAEAFLELMDRHSLAMYKVARAMLRNDEDAADAIQSTILICYEKLDTLREPRYFKTWMTRILINECNKILQHYRNLDFQEEFAESSAQDMSMAEFEFKEMLRGVSEKYRVVLVLYYVEGFKIQEIAKLLELNENTVKTRLVRAREQIGKMYGEAACGPGSLKCI